MEKEAKEKTKLEWHLPILAKTADVTHTTYEECLKSGMDGYVSNPFEEENLYKSVAKSFKANPISDSSCTSSVGFMHRYYNIWPPHCLCL
ncbi:hypothetical protein YC2023_074340 [Brassica napus]